MQMNAARGVLVIAALVTAVVLQASVFARLGLPGATPALLLVVGASLVLVECVRRAVPAHAVQLCFIHVFNTFVMELGGFYV